MALKRGLFVVIEGADGTGKSTQVLQLTKRLNDAGYPCTNMRFPDRYRNMLTELSESLNHPIQPSSNLLTAEIGVLFVVVTPILLQEHADWRHDKQLSAVQGGAI